MVLAPSTFRAPWGPSNARLMALSLIPYSMDRSSAPVVIVSLFLSSTLYNLTSVSGRQSRLAE